QFHVVLEMSQSGVDAPGVQVWHPAATLSRRVADLDVVFLKRADRRLADLRLLVIDDAGVEEGDFQALALRGAFGDESRLPDVLFEPSLESFRVKSRQDFFAVNADELFH